jgi:hypothetical protein
VDRFDVGVVGTERQRLGLAQGFLEFGGEFVESHGCALRVIRIVGQVVLLHPFSSLTISVRLAPVR